MLKTFCQHNVASTQYNIVLHRENLITVCSIQPRIQYIIDLLKCVATMFADIAGE